MILRAGLFAALCAAPAFAQTNGFDAVVEAEIVAFQNAVEAENLITHLAEHEHPVLEAYIAQLIGMNVADYRTVLARLQTNTAQSSDVHQFDVETQNLVYGSTGAAQWAIMPYTMQLIDEGGGISSTGCNYFLVFEDEGEVYLTALYDGTSGYEGAVAVYPMLGDMIEGAKPCS